MVGHVTVPVSLHKSADQVDDVSFKTLHAECGTPVSQERTCPTCAVKVSGEGATVRAFELGPGQFVKVESAELEQALAGKELVLDRFVPRELVKTAMLDTTYLVAPSSDDLRALRAYDGLLQALERTHLVGLGRLGLYSKERVAGVWPLDVEGAGVVLGLTTLFPVAGIRVADATDIHARVAGLGSAAASKQEVALFAQALEERHVPAAFQWRAIARYYPSKLRKLVEAKQKGGEIVIAPQAPSAAPQDLMDALKRSVKAARKKRPVRAEV